jgi:hypothetical protein
VRKRGAPRERAHPRCIGFTSCPIKTRTCNNSGIKTMRENALLQQFTRPYLTPFIVELTPQLSVRVLSDSFTGERTDHYQNREFVGKPQGMTI